MSGARRAIKIGRHLWAQCPECGRLVKLTGWTRGVHICVDEAVRL